MEERERNYIAQQKIIKELCIIKKKLEETMVSVVYIQMTMQYYEVILLVDNNGPFE
jgi:hypothetical protein